MAQEIFEKIGRQMDKHIEMLYEIDAKPIIKVKGGLGLAIDGILYFLLEASIWTGLMCMILCIIKKFKK